MSRSDVLREVDGARHALHAARATPCAQASSARRRAARGLTAEAQQPWVVWLFRLGAAHWSELARSFCWHGRKERAGRADLACSQGAHGAPAAAAAASSRPRSPSGSHPASDHAPNTKMAPVARTASGERSAGAGLGLLTSRGRATRLSDLKSNLDPGRSWAAEQGAVTAGAHAGTRPGCALLPAIHAICREYRRRPNHECGGPAAGIGKAAAPARHGAMPQAAA